MEIGNKYIFFDKEGKLLGAGIYHGNYIEEIPNTCGCNGIHVEDVDIWHDILEPDANMILRMIRKGLEGSDYEIHLFEQKKQEERGKTLEKKTSPS